MRVLLLAVCVALAAAKPPPGPVDQEVTPQPEHHRRPEIPVDDHFEYRNPDRTDDGEELFESDMVLTEEQKSAVDRQAVSNLWPLTVNFAISSSSAADRTAIMAGIQEWRDHTCLQFNEVAEGSSAYHINVIKSSGCWSYVGKIRSSGKQDLSIGSGCTGLGTVVHEFGHAMGLNHQQSRTDRDTYVEILSQNIQSGKEGNFAISWSSTNYSVPYDLTSVMHYGNYYFSSNGQPTIRVRDILHENLIGSRAGFSHRDKQIANAMYNCAGSCSSPPTCQNGGYVDKTCQCVCPPNTSGSTCENLTGSYYPTPSCGNTDMRAPGTITSPNYPSNFPVNVDCIWIITAPQGQQVRVAVTDMKMLYRSNGRCYWDWMQLRYTGDIYNDDVLACDEELTGQTYTSTGNQFIVKFHSGNYGWHRGFSADVTFIGDPVTTTTTQATTTQATTTQATTTTTGGSGGGHCGGARRIP